MAPSVDGPASWPTLTAGICQVLARVLDGSRFREFKANYGTTLVTGM